MECDGATYHRSATARDRDKLRERVLRGLGWEIIRLWSTDWWADRAGTLKRIDDQLKELLVLSRAAKPSEMESTPKEEVQDIGANINRTDAGVVPETLPITEFPARPQSDGPLYAGPVVSKARAQYPYLSNRIRLLSSPGWSPMHSFTLPMMRRLRG